MGDTKWTRRTLLKTGMTTTAAAGLAGLTTLQAVSSTDAASREKSSGDGQSSPVDGTEPEPNLEIARSWWPENPNKWTPIGWKDHPLQFNVLFNGSLICPNLTLIFNDPYIGKDEDYIPLDDRTVVQGWNDTEAPILWSRVFPYTYSARAFEGAQMRQEVFAHLSGASYIETGKEPLFAWVRLTVEEVCDGFFPDNEENHFTFKIKIRATDFVGGMTRIKKFVKAYPNPLAPDRDAYDPSTGWRLVETDGKVCLGIAPGQDCTLDYESPGTRESDLNIQVKLRKGASVDLLVPAGLMERDAFDQELALGYEAALEEANDYWSKKPSTAARFDVPENEVNQIFRRHLQFAEIIAQKHEDGHHYMHLGCALSYDTLGPVTTIMLTAGHFLNLLGYHSVVEKYLQGFKALQGKVTPVGKLFKPHPGYMNEPKTSTSYNYFSAHGALLWVISDHAMLSGDPEIIDEWTPVVVKACDWIQYALTIEVPGGVSGIMPPGMGSDIGIVSQEVWNDAFAYKGLTTAIRFLRSIGHPRAEEFAETARAYREKYQAAMRARTRKMPTWRGPDGKERHVVPTCLSDKYSLTEIRNTFSLDVGALCLVWGGLLDADDELMENTRLWFREGPPKKFAIYDQVGFGIPCLFHETSSCEAHWSWVMWHSWQLGDRQRYLESMYSIWMAELSQQTYTLCETRGGIFGLTPYCPAHPLARFAVIDDRIQDDELHLLRMMPLAWLATDREAIFENMPTYYGPIDLRVKLAGAGEELEVSFAPHFRAPPEKVVLHVPPAEGLKTVRLNGEQIKWDRNQDYVTIA